MKFGDRYRFPLREGILRQPHAALRRSARNNTLVKDAGGDAGRQPSQENLDGEQLETLPDKDDSEDATADPGPQDYWTIAGDLSHQTSRCSSSSTIHARRGRTTNTYKVHRRLTPNQDFSGC